MYLLFNQADVAAGKRGQVDRAVGTLQRLYGNNVFPAMKVTWGSYPNNLGHMDFPGCFRCHDEEHKAKDGSAISQDCELCHTQQEIPTPSAQAAN